MGVRLNKLPRLVVEGLGWGLVGALSWSCAPSVLAPPDVDVDAAGLPVDWPYARVQTLRLAATAGLTDTLPWSIEPDVHSLSVGARADARIGAPLMVAESPTGKVLLDGLSVPSDPELAERLGPFAGLALSPNPVFRRHGRIPNSPSLVLEPGDWSFVFGAHVLETLEPTDAELDVVMVERTASPDGPQQLDLRLLFAEAEGITAQNAEGHPVVRRMLRRVRRIFRQVDVHIGSIQYGEFLLEGTLSMGPDCSGSNQLRALTAGLPVDAPGFVNVAFVDGISCPNGGGGGVLGWAPMGLPLASSNVVYVNMALLRIDDEDLDVDDLLASVTAHEVGHALGLFHSSEAGHLVHDNLGDTPEGEAGQDNLMYFTENGPELTDDQRWVLERSPYLRPMLP